MATSKPGPSFVSEVEEVLMCQICLNPMVTREPRALQCLHTFCFPCLEEIVSKIPGNATAISCPTCRKNTELPQGKVLNLPFNFAVEQTNDMVRSLDNVQSCNSCWSKGNFIQADIKCPTCERRFCERCCERHDGIPGFQSHPKLPIARKKKEEKPDVCSKHGSEYLRFCSKCKLLLCVDCLMSGEHESHKDSLSDIAQTAEKVRSLLLKTQDELKIKISESKAKLEMYVNRENEFQKVKQEIIETANWIKRRIDSQIEQLLQELQENCFKVSKERIAVITDTCDKSEDLYQTIRQCADKNECEIIQYYKNMEEKLKELKMVDTKLGAGKEPPSPSFKKGSESKVGNIVFESNAPDQYIMPYLLTEDKNYNLQVAKAKLVNQFRDSNVCRYRGVGALSNGRAVVVSSDYKRLLLYDSRAGCLSTLTTSKNTSHVSAYRNRILYGDSERNCMYEVSVSNKNLTILAEYQIPCKWASYLTFDSSGNILLTYAGGIDDLRKYSPQGRCLWNTNIETSSMIRVAVLSHRRRDRYITAHASPPGVKIWNEDGKQENTLNIASGKNGRGIRGVTISPAGTILVADYNNHTVSEYSEDGSFLQHVVTEDDGIRCPWDISCGPTGLLWVTLDQGGLVVFKLQ